MHLLVGEADHRAHAALDAALLHDPAALADELQGRLEVDRLGGDRGRVLARGMSGHLERCQLHALALRLVPKCLQVGDRGGQDGRLRVDGAVQVLSRSVEDQAREREAQGRIGALEHGGGRRRALDEIGAHANVLGPLAGEDECVPANRGWARRRRVIGLV